MKNADLPAMPQSATSDGYGCNYGDETDTQVPTGLTKREIFAMHAMNKCIEIQAKRGDLSCVLNKFTSDAVKCADALLAELEK